MASERLQELRRLARIEARPYLYAEQLEYIDLLRQQGDLLAVREAREHMYSRYPFTEELYRAFISEERSQPQAPDHADILAGLYQRATGDLLSAEIWSEYLAFVVEKHPDDTELVEKLFKQATAATNGHYTKSHLVFNAFADYEEARLTEAQPAQLGKIFDLYMKQLSVPHAELAQTFSRYSMFVTKNDNQHYEEHLVKANKVYSRTLKACVFFDQEEAALAQGEYSWPAHQAYLQALRKKKEYGFMVSALYERAIAHYCFEGTIWNEYLLFLASKVGNLHLCKEVCQRAVRYCGWMGDLWCHHLRFQEKGLMTQDTATKLDMACAVLARVQQTVDSGMSWEDATKVGQAFISLARRNHDASTTKQVHTACKAYLAWIKAQFQYPDPLCRLESLWAELTGLACKEPAAARAIWEDVVKEQPKNTEAWLGYAQLERLLSPEDASKRRSIYKRAANQTTSEPERIHEAWLRFESLYGDIEQVEQAVGAIHQRRLIYEKNRAKAQLGETPAQPVGPSANSSEIHPKRKWDKNQEAGAGDKPPKKPRADSHEKAAEKVTDKTPKASRTVLVSNLPDNIKESVLRQHLHTCGGVKNIQVIRGGDEAHTYAFVEFTALEAAKQALQLGELAILDVIAHIKPPNTAQDDKTVFVCNFSSRVTAKTLKSWFDPFGRILDIRLPQSKPGKTRRFAYIEFATSESAQASLALNNTFAEQEHPLSVAISDPVRKKARGATKPALKVLEIENLPEMLQETDVLELCQPFGKVERCWFEARNNERICFVQFETEEETGQALMLNELDLGEHILSARVVSSVATSDTEPKPKREPAQNPYLQPVPPSTKSAASLVPARFKRKARLQQ